MKPNTWPNFNLKSLLMLKRQVIFSAKGSDSRGSVSKKRRTRDRCGLRFRNDRNGHRRRLPT